MKILIAEDDKSIARGLEIFLESRGNKVIAADNGNDALKLTLREKPELVISDVKMPQKTGIEFLEDLRGMNNHTPFIIVTANATVENAVHALKIGANDFLLKPLNLEELGLKISKIQKDLKLLTENRNLKKKLKQFQQPEIIGNSTAIKNLRQLIDKIKYDKDITVMIYGESGTGKELVARSVHNFGIRSNESFVAVNCAAIPDNLMESEFFGYRKGAFTGAINNKNGLFHTANDGTLFLDEVSEMSKSMQAKLLRVIQERQFQPLGGTEIENVNIQIIGASNDNLKKMVEEGKFREDLYYRLSVIELVVPPLRNRKSDIPLLLEYFINKVASSMRFSSEALGVLQNYNWPGNIRELENFVRKMKVINQNEIIDISHLPKEFLSNNGGGLICDGNLDEEYKTAIEKTIRNFEKQYLTHHLKKNNYNISKTCEKIGVSRVTLHKKINDLDLNSTK